MKIRKALGFVLVIGLAPVQLNAQIQTLDLSHASVETVIPAEFDGGYFARIGRMVVNDRGRAGSYASVWTGVIWRPPLNVSSRPRMA